MISVGEERKCRNQKNYKSIIKWSYERANFEHFIQKIETEGNHRKYITMKNLKMVDEWNTAKSNKINSNRLGGIYLGSR